MLYFTIAFLCAAGLFLALLEDRFRIWTTLGIMAGTYFLALGAAFALRWITHSQAQQIPLAAGCLLFFFASLFLFRNNPLQKLFVALLCLCSFAFLETFIPLLLGVMSFPVSGAAGGVISVLATCLFLLLLGLCLYRPFRHFSDRGPSGFLAGMCLVTVALYVLCLGKLDFLFRTNVPAARLLAAALLYCALIFAFRSLYQAGRFREKRAQAAAREHLLDMEAIGFSDRLAAVREVRAVQKSGEYALDTVKVLLADGYAEKILAYADIAKANSARDPILAHYHDDPHLNAVIASKAAFAAQNNIDFFCNAATEGSPIVGDELCVIADEMLARACRDAAGYDGNREIRFTAFPGERTLTLEALYSADLPAAEKFSWRGKSLSQVLAWLFDDSPEGPDDLWGLENTQEIVSRYSGKLSLSGAPGKLILRASLRF